MIQISFFILLRFVLGVVLTFKRSISLVGHNKKNEQHEEYRFIGGIWDKFYREAI